MRRAGIYTGQPVCLLVTSEGPAELRLTGYDEVLRVASGRHTHVVR